MKKSVSANFDVSQGSYDGTEVSELIGIFILAKINKIVHIDNHGIYRDDGLMIVPDNKRDNDSIRKKLFKLFKNLGFEITVKMNIKVVQYLDVELRLLEGSVSAYMKPNTALKYVNTGSEKLCF